MPRRPRMYLPGIPVHLIQRGNNHQPCFFTVEDCNFYLECLDRSLTRYQVQLHAYVLMTNHVHLLVTPAEEEGISRMMALLGCHYVTYMNRRYQRTGTLWEGRHRSSLVDAEDYLFRCYRYIELNPVRAGLVNHPEEYRWSSYHHNALGIRNAMITEHALYLGLSIEEHLRHSYYKELFKRELSARDIAIIHNTLNQNFPLGNDRFRKEIEQTLRRRLGYELRGRPFAFSSG